MSIASPLVNGSSTFRAGVCFSTGPGEFYIQTEDSILQSDFIKKKMHEIYGESALGDEGQTATVRSNCSTNLETRQIKLCEIHVGSVVAARFPEDNCWYRAEVLSTDMADRRSQVEPEGSSNLPRVQVLFVDYGNKEWIDFNNRQLLQLDASLGINKFPPLAVRCAANVPKLHLWDEMMKTKWSNLIIDRCGTDVDCSWTLRLFDRMTGEDLTESITNTVMAESGMSQFPETTPTSLLNSACAVVDGSHEVNPCLTAEIADEPSLNSQCLEHSTAGDFEIINRCDPDLLGNNEANGFAVSNCEHSHHESPTKMVAVSKNETPESEVIFNEETGVKEYAVKSYPVGSKKSGKTMAPLRKYLAKCGVPNLESSFKGSERSTTSCSENLKLEKNFDIDPVCRYHELQRSAPEIRSPTPPISDAEDDVLVVSPSAVAAVVNPPSGNDSFSGSDDSGVEPADRDPEIRRRRNGELRLREVKRLEKERMEMIEATRSAAERIQPGTNLRDPFKASPGYDENEGLITVNLPQLPPIQTGSQVHILYADGPVNVFVLAAELRLEYQQFMAAMTQGYASNQATNSGSAASYELITSEMVTPGVIAAAEINREWWRVKVLRVNSARGKATVRLVDVGKDQEVDMIQMKLLRPQFAASPAYAVRIEVEANCCTLTWSPRTKGTLNEYLKAKYGLGGTPLSFNINRYKDSTDPITSRYSSFDSEDLRSSSVADPGPDHESRQTVELIPVGTLGIPGTGELVLKEFEEEIKRRVGEKNQQEVPAAANGPAVPSLVSDSAAIQTSSAVRPANGDWSLFEGPIPGVIDPATEAGQAILQNMDSQLLEDMTCQEGSVEDEESDSYLSDDERRRKERSKRKQIAKQRRKRRAEKEMLKFQNANKTVDKPTHRGWESPCTSEHPSTNATNEDYTTNQGEPLPIEMPSQSYENARAGESNQVSGNLPKLSSAGGDGQTRDRIVVRLLGPALKSPTVTSAYEIVNVFSPSSIIVRCPVQQRHFGSLTARLKERYDGDKCPPPLKRDELQLDNHYVYRYEINPARDVEWRRVRVKYKDAARINCMLVDFGKRFTLSSGHDCENKFYPLYYPDSVPVLMHRCRLRGKNLPDRWSSEIVSSFRLLLSKSIVLMQLHPVEPNSTTHPSTGTGNYYELEIKQDPLKSVVEAWMRDHCFALESSNKSHENADYEDSLNESSKGFWSASAFDQPLPHERGLVTDSGNSAPTLGIDEEDYDEFTDEDDDDEEDNEVVVPLGGPVAVVENVSGREMMDVRQNYADEYERTAKVHDWLQSHGGAVGVVSPIREPPYREVTSPSFNLPLGSSASDQCLARTHPNFNREISNEKFSESCSLASFDAKHSTRRRILANGRGRAMKKVEPELDASIHLGSEASNILSSRGHGLMDSYRFRKFPSVVPPPTGVALDVLMCHADTPGMFYVQSVEMSQRAKTIHIELNNVFGPPQSLDFRQAPPFELGELERFSSCAAPFPVPRLDKSTGLYVVDDTCNWYRALIKSEDPYGFVVQYVDFGNKDLCSANFLRPLPPTHLFPPQCYMCRLVNVPADLEVALTGPFTTFLLNSIDLDRGGCWFNCTFLKKDPELVYLVRLVLTKKDLDVGEYLMGLI